MTLEACLPVHLQTPTTTITQIAAGLSGAGVHRVEAAGGLYVLKIAAQTSVVLEGAAANASVDEWRRSLRTLELAAHAGLAPAVIHVDETRRAVVSALVTDRSFPAFYGDPWSRDAALAQLGTTLRRVHELPLPRDAPESDPREFLATIWPRLLTGFAMPSFVRDAVERLLTGAAPPRDRALVLSHNDVNPSNLIYDGERLWLVDWETAGPNDPLYDLATASVFLRMDEQACQQLLAIHDERPIAALPTRFAYCRRLVAVMCGALFLRVARDSGHAGATGEESLESTLPLGELYQRMRSGTLSPATAEGKWAFGLALVKASQTGAVTQAT